MNFDTNAHQATQKKGLDQSQELLVNLVVFGWFMGFSLVVYFMFYTLITIDAAFHIFVGIGGAATLIHYFRSRPKGRKPISALIVLNFFGLGALLCGLFLATNYFLRGPAYPESYQIVAVDKDPKNGIRMRADEIKLDSDDLEGFNYIVNYDQWKWTEFKTAKAIRVFYADGFFGYRICLGQQLVYE